MKVKKSERKRYCNSCSKTKIYKNFYIRKRGWSAIDGTYREYTCIKCRAKHSWKNWKTYTHQEEVFMHIRKQAKKKGLVFNLELADIIFPEYCPVLGIKLERGRSDNSYSVDRIKNELGYIKGNILIVSLLANRIKNSSTPDEIIKVGEFYKCLGA